MKLILYELYQKMLTTMGPTNWWPADSKAEIIIGAIMIQNTTQANAERAVANFKAATKFDPNAIRRLSTDELQAIIRPAVFFKNKSQAIHTIFDCTKPFDDNYDLIKRHFGSRLRKELLRLHGIGPETADVLLIYVFDTPVFVSDKYARTLFEQMGITGLRKYQDLAKIIKLDDPFTIKDAQEFHGLIDEFGKQWLHLVEKFHESFLADDQLLLK